MILAPYPCLGAAIDAECSFTPTYPARECTSGAAFWGSQYTGKPWPLWWGSAMNWPAAARAAGFQVDTNCVPNSIMCIPPRTNGSGSYGHVAYVTGDAFGGMVEVSEVNWKPEHGWDYRSAPIAHCQFIHLVPPTPDPPIPTYEEIEMLLIAVPNGTIYLLGGDFMVPVSDIPTKNNFIAAGVKQVSVDAAMYASLIAKFPQ